ncbi:MAG: urate hydroxylase PuuD [Candidatus Binatia bacterium]
MDAVSSLLRWIHIVAGIIWIGHLYFFNFVNAQFAPTIDAETKKKVVPELMPRALYFFRWGAAWTWVTGVLLLALVFYHGGIMFDLGGEWDAISILAIVLVFVAPFIYDALYKNVLTDPKIGFIGGLILSTVMLYFMAWAAGFSFRAYTIHLGAMFGTIMAYNVWFRIWPAQQQIIRAAKDGTAADPAVVALAGSRSKHNTYMSVPLVFTMMNQHATWAASPLTVAVIVLIGWAAVYWLYQKSKTVKGF